MQFTAKQLADAIGISQTHANNLLVQLEKEQKIKRTLRDESKQSSNRNPWVYGLFTGS
jgi:hypothetical protein